MELENCTSVNWPDCPCYKLATDRGYARCSRDLDCHLTPADFSTIAAAINGEGRLNLEKRWCDNCKHFHWGHSGWRYCRIDGRARHGFDATCDRHEWKAAQ